MENNKKIIIAGGGHAGIEAALAISRMGGSCVIVTMDVSALGRLSCNPAIGGLGKSHLVKEIDALGGIMGLAADATSLQMKTLNKTKGRAVWALRAQVDKKKYSGFVKRWVSLQKNISLFEGEVVSFSTKNERISCVILKDGTKINCGALIITSGTFLKGLIHIGRETFPAGRIGERASLGLSDALINYGIKLGRLKTGTPPRLDRFSIDWDKTKIAGGDVSPSCFSLFTKRPFSINQENCYVVNTNRDVHALIHRKLHSSAMFSGKISGVGPRYCPSIEDKVFRFKERGSHHLFLEPEWSNSKQIYVNGFSTSLSREVQLAALKKIEAFKNVRLIRPGYAIEYDYCPPYQLSSSLMLKKIKGLFCAGQINGTSGYEEAAAQGLVAGANSFLYIYNKKPLVFNRGLSYIGVLIDDLITSHLNEPYRMFTSRAENRLYLRSDNCYERLFHIARDFSLLSKPQQKTFAFFRDSLSLASAEIEKISVKKTPLSLYLKRPEASVFDFIFPKNLLYKEALFSIETAIKYAGYIENEQERQEKTQKLESFVIPDKINYNGIPGLSLESRRLLCRVMPETIGQASRIAGIRPTDITLIGAFLRAGFHVKH